MRIGLLVFLSACAVVNGNGDAARESVDVSGVTDFENTTKIELSITGGAAEETGELTCDENLMEYIFADVDGDTLTLRVQNGIEIRPDAACRLEVAVGSVRTVRSSGSGVTSASGDLTDFELAFGSGSGALEVAGIASTDVDLGHTGSGSLVAAGTVGRVDIDADGSGDTDAVDLLATDAVVRNSGSGAVSLTASRDVEIHLSGSGPVDVYGEHSGTVSVDDTGSGTATLH